MVLFRRLLGDVLRDKRTQRGLTLREVSAEARVSLGYISEIERGQKEASSELLSSLCEALDLPLSDVLREVSDAVAHRGGRLRVSPRRSASAAAPRRRRRLRRLRPLHPLSACRLAGRAPVRRPLAAGLAELGDADRRAAAPARLAVPAVDPQAAPAAHVAGGAIWARCRFWSSIVLRQPHHPQQVGHARRPACAGRTPVRKHSSVR